MAKEEEYLQAPGKISVKEAAAKLKLSQKRVLQLVQTDRIHANKVGGRYMILIEDFEEYRKKPHGRTRTKPTKWRTYRAGAKVRELHIEVQAIPEKRKELQTRLQSTVRKQAHLFPYTMQRYILADVDNPNAIIIQLVWKNTEILDEQTLHDNLDLLKKEFADLLDWPTARYLQTQAIIHT